VRPQEGNAENEKKRLGEVLYEGGQISAADLKKALLDQQGRVIRRIYRPFTGSRWYHRA
jgi:hypothetical protein